MKRRRVVVGVVALVVVGGTLAALWPRGPRPCRATFEQVQSGMTLAEVAATVGGPPGTYTSGPVMPFIMCNFGGHRAVEWHASDATLTVIYGEDGRVFCPIVTDALSDYRPPLDRLRARLGL